VTVPVRVIVRVSVLVTVLVVSVRVVVVDNTVINWKLSVAVKVIREVCVIITLSNSITVVKVVNIVVVSTRCMQVVVSTTNEVTVVQQEQSAQGQTLPKMQSTTVHGSKSNPLGGTGPPKHLGQAGSQHLTELVKAGLQQPGHPQAFIGFPIGSTAWAKIDRLITKNKRKNLIMLPAYNHHGDLILFGP
jgi:hypothetical protein